MTSCFKASFVVAAFLACPMVQARTISKTDHGAGKTCISADYTAAKAACSSQAGNKVAAEKCNALAGDAKSSCIVAAKLQDGKT